MARLAVASGARRLPLPAGAPVARAVSSWRT